MGKECTLKYCNLMIQLQKQEKRAAERARQKQRRDRITEGKHNSCTQKGGAGCASKGESEYERQKSCKSLVQTLETTRNLCRSVLNPAECRRVQNYVDRRWDTKHVRLDMTRMQAWGPLKDMRKAGIEPLSRRSPAFPQVRSRN